jgi:hypothetical protein
MNQATTNLSLVSIFHRLQPPFLPLGFNGQGCAVHGAHFRAQRLYM